MSRLGSLDPAPPLDPIRYLDSSASRCNIVRGVPRVSPHLRVCRELSENRTLVSRRGGVHSLKRRLTRNGFNILSCEFCEQHIVETSPLSPSLSPPLLSPTHFLWSPLLQHPGGPFPPTVQPFPRRRLKFDPPALPPWLPPPLSHRLKQTLQETSLFLQGCRGGGVSLHGTPLTRPLDA